jgi:uncharacterized protein (TIGR04255 family)
MSERMHPRRLKHDAILEALLEIRFDNSELPEVTVGRLIDHSPWREYERVRAPISDIPAVVRLSDPNLRFQPLVELKEQGKQRLVKIDTNVISFHNLRPYLGWDNFRTEIDAVVTLLFNKISGISVHRLGLRYINALKPSRHYVTNISDLNMDISVTGAAIKENSNINYRFRPDKDFFVPSRVATPDFVHGNLFQDSIVYIDVDVFTPQNYRVSDPTTIRAWINEAHEHEKDAFLKLLPDRVINQLKEN